MTSQESEFTTLCESCRDYLTILARSRVGPALGSKLDPADLVQQTMLRAYQKREDYRGADASQLRAWLRTILGNLMTDSLRKYRVSAGGRERSLQDLLDDSSRRLENLLRDGGSSPSHKAGRGERIVLLTAAMGRLPEDQRRAVELRHLRGDSLEQIAGLMGRSVPAVAGLIRRGLRSLREALDILA